MLFVVPICSPDVIYIIDLYRTCVLNVIGVHLNYVSATSFTLRKVPVAKSLYLLDVAFKLVKHYSINSLIF